MIKVLEEKEVPRAQVECSNCHSLLEYGNADLHESYRNQPDYNISANGRLFKNYELTCPVCGCKVIASWIIQKGEKV